MSNFSDYISAGVTRYGDWGRVVRKVTRLELDHGELTEHFELAQAMQMHTFGQEDWWFLTGVTYKPANATLATSDSWSEFIPIVPTLGENSCYFVEDINSNYLPDEAEWRYVVPRAKATPGIPYCPERIRPMIIGHYFKTGGIEQFAQLSFQEGVVVDGKPGLILAQAWWTGRDGDKPPVWRLGDGRMKKFPDGVERPDPAKGIFPGNACYSNEDNYLYDVHTWWGRDADGNLYTQRYGVDDPDRGV